MSKPETVTVKHPQWLVTIDSQSTRDIDDAISVEASPEGGYRVVIAITNPLHLVKPGSTEDENAKLLGATVYVRDAAVRKMLPSDISEHRGSLIAGATRKVFAFEVHLDQDLELVSLEIGRQTMTVTHRLSYSDIPEILKDTSHELHEPMSHAAALGHKMLAKRRTKGALALYDLARMLYMDDEGRVIQLARREDVVGNIIVQELMVLGNTLVAGYMVNHDIPAIFRNHQAKSAAPDSATLAQTISTWIASDNMDAGKFASTFAVVMGKASYGASVNGHYALALPFYAHITSPLRRYADLINLRQLRAHLKGIPLPYTKEELEELAVFLNEKAADRIEERSEGFKNVVRAHASRAMESGQLERLADHEMVQAIKMSTAAGAIPEQLSGELVRRFDRSIMTDKIADCLFLVGPTPWPTDLGNAFSRWLVKSPTVAVHLLMHAQQTNHLRKLEITASGQATSFDAKVMLQLQEGGFQVFSGRGSRKKDAEQQACVRAVLTLVGVGTEMLDTEKAAQPQISGNPKGALLELCQKHGWPAPSFQASGQGPSHAMEFSATAQVMISGQTYSDRVSGAGNKKEAEANVSAMLLAKISALVPKAVVKTSNVSASNTDSENMVGALQEHCQKNGLPMPEYTFVMLQEAPPKFRATVKLTSIKDGVFTGEASSKQDAKKIAANKAMQAVKG